MAQERWKIKSKYIGFIIARNGNTLSKHIEDFIFLYIKLQRQEFWQNYNAFKIIKNYTNKTKNNTCNGILKKSIKVGSIT